MAEPDLSTRTRLLERLKCGGGQSAQQLGEDLGRTPAAVRQLLGRLKDEGLVQFHERCEGVGRPSQIWTLTAQGHATFEDRHGALAAGILDALRSLHGEAGVEQVMDERARLQLDGYRERLRGVGGSLLQRVQGLARLRCQDGYMATHEALEDGSYLLIENHCPIAEAAQCCGRVCEAELVLFRTVLGLDVEVARVEHQREGDRRCVYRIRQLA